MGRILSPKMQTGIQGAWTVHGCARLARSSEQWVHSAILPTVTCSQALIEIARDDERLARLAPILHPVGERLHLFAQASVRPTRVLTKFGRQATRSEFVPPGHDSARKERVYAG